MAKRENRFQAVLKSELKLLFPGCIVMKNDPTDIQGIPDLTVIYKNKYAFLECKREEEASRQPNQKHYIDQATRYAFGDFVYPENKSEVLNRLYDYFCDVDD